MSEHLNLTDLTNLYSFVAQQPDRCPEGHANAEVTVSEDGVFRMYCPTCGFIGWSSEAGARRLGWIE